MDEYVVELFIDSEEEDIRFSSLNEKEMERWKKELEIQALSEYHNRKIKIKSKKI